MKLWLVMLLVVVVDQLVKLWVIRNNWFWVLNTGAAFSIGAGSGWFGWVVGIVVVLGGIFYIKTQSSKFKNRGKEQDSRFKIHPFDRLRTGDSGDPGRTDDELRGMKYEGYWEGIAWGLFVGGAVGNLIDRVRLGGVVDFIKVGSFPVFNVADVALNVGVGVLIWGWWRNRK